MSSETYYIVQTTPTLFVHNDGVMFPRTEGFGAEKAAHLTLADAHHLYREYKARCDASVPRRFPRIIKVTTTRKTITNNR